MKKIKLTLPVLTTISVSTFLVSCHENKENIQKKDNESKFIFEKPTHNKYHNPDELFKEWNEIKYKKDFLYDNRVWDLNKNYLTTFYFQNPFKKENSKYDFSLSPFNQEDKKHIFDFDLNHLGQFIAISNYNQFKFFMNDLRTAFNFKNLNKVDTSLLFFDYDFLNNFETNNPFYVIQKSLVESMIKTTDLNNKKVIEEKLKNYFSKKIVLFSCFTETRNRFTEELKTVDIKFPKTNNLKDLIEANLTTNKNQDKYDRDWDDPLVFDFYELEKDNS
ncbi:hypothetical protein ACR34G_00650 [Mycoplasma sp. 480]|uniref:hypothetical protein n=1 Tax=Mycoplasma sp. 480 TaxID=3440155 RepID=UPI003F510706